MSKMTLYFVMREGRPIEELCARSERQAHMALGRYLVPTDVVLEGMILTDLGRTACNGVNPYRVVHATVEIPDPA